MPIIKILPHPEYCPDGAEVKAAPGTSICEALLENGIAIEHACDMSCACTTCHVIVREGLGSLNEAEETEEDLLDRAWGLEAPIPSELPGLSGAAGSGRADSQVLDQSRQREPLRPAMRQIVLDTETTGFYANHPDNPDRMVEIGCVELVNRKLTGNNLHFYLNPGRDSDEGALRVHGLTTQFLSDKPRFEEIAQQLVDYVAGAEIIIHNAPFDLSFL